MSIEIFRPLRKKKLHWHKAFLLYRRVVFALIESWPWAREELEMEMARQASKDLEAKQGMV